MLPKNWARQLAGPNPIPGLSINPYAPTLNSIVHLFLPLLLQVHLHADRLLSLPSDQEAGPPAAQVGWIWHPFYHLSRFLVLGPGFLTMLIMPFLVRKEGVSKRKL